MKTLHRINPIGDTLRRLTLAGSTARIAGSLAALALANTAAHAAPTVWNVNMAAAASPITEITTGDNYVGAASENTASSTWNNITTSANGIALADSTGSGSAGVTLDLSAVQGVNPINPYWPGVPGTGDKIFNAYLSGGGVTSNMTINNLPAGTYDLIIYSNWFWGGAVAYPVTQTLGTGLIGTAYVNTPATQIPGGLVQDTDLADNGGITGNWMRISGLTPTGGQLGFQLGDGVNGPYNGFQLVKVDLADSTPPTPSPMTWDSAPAATGETSIAMTATTATDPSGVEYFFTETSGNPGATSSSVWQDSPIYTDTGLTPGTTYSYTVTARDKSLAQNPGTASASASATTPAEDLIAPTPDPMSFDTLPAASSITTITMTATTASDDNGVEYYFTETSGNSGGSDSGWQDSPIYTDGGLNPNTSYTYKVKARDKAVAQNPTADSGTASATTDPETVVSSVWNVNIGNEIDTVDNFAGAAPENNGATKFWNSVTTANPSGLSLADSTTSTNAGVTLTLAGSIGYGNYAPLTSGPEIFSTWIKSSDNFTPFNMVIGGLSFSKTYDLIVYSDWYWKGNGTLPLTLTAGTGLAGTVVLDQISTGTNGEVPGLILDTDPAPNTAIQGNWIRISGLTPDINGNLGFSMGGTNAAFNGFQLVYPAGVVNSGFTTWADANAPGQTPAQDHDDDGVDNGIEYFMGETGSSFTAMPGLDGTNTVTWPMDADYAGTYEVQTSPDLATWTNVDPRPLPSGGNLSYLLPTGLDKRFVRLLVTPTP